VYASTYAHALQAITYSSGNNLFENQQQPSKYTFSTNQVLQKASSTSRAYVSNAAKLALWTMDQVKNMAIRRW